VQAGIREIEVLLDELHEWKKAQVQPKSHRERDRTRRASARLDIKKVMTSRLKVARRLWSEGWDLVDEVSGDRARRDGIMRARRTL
jgi:hypothetical protein